MAPNDAPTHQSKVESILDIATHLIQWVTDLSHASTDTPDFSSAPFPDLSLYFSALPLSYRDVMSRQRIELDQKGVQLWNACCRVGLSQDGVGDKMKLHVAQSRAFAWFLVESVARERARDESGDGKGFRSGCRAAKHCLAVGDLQLAAKVIERLAERPMRTQERMGDVDDTASKAADSMRAEVLLLQLTLAWKRDRLDLADHYYNTYIACPGTSSLQVKAVDLLYEIGHLALEERQSDLAVKWLKRAASMLDTISEGCAMAEARDLCLNVRHTALIATNEPDAGTEAARVLALLKTDFGHKLAVTLLNLEILTRDPDPDSDIYFAELLKMIRTVHIIDTNHNLILHYVHQLKSFSTGHALKALKQYIVQRLAPDSFLEKTANAIVTFIWMALSEPTIQPTDIDAELILLHQIWNRKLDAEAAHAVFLMLWKRITETEDKGSQHELLAWCTLISNSLLENAGERNLGKIQRKMVVINMKIPDMQAAKEIFSKMSPAVQQNPLSLYLAYSVALRCRDEAAAEAALSSIVKIRDKDHRLLLGCVGETMKYGDQRQGAILLQRVLDKFNYNLPAAIDTCTLLRCTARLLMSLLSSQAKPDEEILERLCSIIKAAARFMNQWVEPASEARSRASFPTLECEWFQRNSYCTAVKQAESWPAKYLLDLMAHSQKMLKILSSFDKSKVPARNKHLITSIAMQAVLLLCEARRCDTSWTIEDIPRTSYQGKERPDTDQLRFHLYQCAFKQYTELEEILAAFSSHEPNQDDDARSQLVTLLPGAFEALIFIQAAGNWDIQGKNNIDLSQFIAQAASLNAPAKTFALLADLILSSTTANGESEQSNSSPQVPLPLAITLLSSIIGAMRRQPDYDIERAARWIRCVVQLVLDSRPQRDGLDNASLKDQEYDNCLGIVHNIVDEALVLAAGAVTKPSNQVYPSDELHWLSTTLFNLGVEYWVAEGEEDAKKWTAKAVEVADAMGRNPRKCGGDGGGMAGLLRGKRARMGFNG